MSVPCNDAGEIGLDALSHVLAYLNGRPEILALTSGKMMKGAHDNIAGAIARPDAAGISPARRHIHIDGALNAMVVPFLDEAPDFDPPDLPARHREHLHVRPHNDRNADALRRARGAQAACRAHRIGDRIFEVKQHNPVGFAQRPCRACHVGPFLRTKNEWFRETPAIALLELSAWQPRCVEAARPCSSVHFR